MGLRVIESLTLSCLLLSLHSLSLLQIHRCRSSSPWVLGLRKGLFRHYSSMGVMWHGP
jgi:hypothetical protein